jgi:hypothetical protein
MTTTAKIALAAALVLGAGSAVLANDIETNPSTGQSVREWQDYLAQSQKHSGSASYGYAGSQTQQDDVQPGKRSHNR